MIFNRKIYKYPHICVGMATKNISITEEAYKRLANLRNRNESFSEIIVKITRKNDWRDYFGILSKNTADELEKNIKKLRDKHIKERRDRVKFITKELD